MRCERNFFDKKGEMLKMGLFGDQNHSANLRPNLLVHRLSHPGKTMGPLIGL